MPAGSSENKYKELKAKMEAAKKAMEDAVKSAFTEMSAGLFAENPNIISFSWTEYTPYFNDGDVCEFSAHTEYPAVTFRTDTGRIVEYNSNTGEWTNSDGTDLNSDEYRKYIDKVAEFLGAFDNDDFETMFGDHVLVTVHADGKVETEAYDHD